MNEISSSKGNLNPLKVRARNWPTEDGLRRLQSAARERNGECLITIYTGPQGRYRFRCAEGHEWEQTAAKTLQGSWCKVCVSIERRTPIGVMHAIAASRGGRCLSLETQAASVRLTWECQLEHVWQASPIWIRQGAWCPECAALERKALRAKQVRDAKPQPRARPHAGESSMHPALTRLHGYAARHGWRCLAQAWAGYYARYEFECANGHRQERAASQFMFGKHHRPRCTQCEAHETDG